MTNQHPITPPLELVDQWYDKCHKQDEPFTLYMTTQAARWGADQELEACVNYIDNNMSGNKAREFRVIRRPKPPSLKEQALEALEHLALGPDPTAFLADMDTIRRALEAQS